MNAPIAKVSLRGSRDPVRLIRALSNVGRLPLMRYLVQPRSEGEVQREFPGVPTGEIRRSLTQLEVSRWITERKERRGKITWSIDSGAVESLRAWIIDQVPTAIPAHRLCVTQLGYELVVLRRQSCVAVLKVLHDHKRTHREVVMATGLQSGTVSDSIARLERASMIKGYRPDHQTKLHLLWLLVELSGK